MAKRSKIEEYPVKLSHEIADAADTFQKEVRRPLKRLREEYEE